jgi:hypothetical protein
MNQGFSIYPPGTSVLKMQRLSEQFSMYPLTNDERVTCDSILAQDPSSKILMMPTHHINELGDLMGFRYKTETTRH